MLTTMDGRWAYPALLCVLLAACSGSGSDPDPGPGPDADNGSDPGTGTDGDDNPVDLPDNDTNGAAISIDNHVALLRYVFDVYTGAAYKDVVMRLPNWSDPAYAGIPYGIEIEAQIVCQNGGTATFVPFVRTSDYGTNYWDFRFDDCQDGDSLLHGNLRRSQSNSHGSSSADVSSDGLTRDTSTLHVSFQGSMSEWTSFASYQQADNLQFRYDDGVSVVTLSDVNTQPRRGGLSR